MPFQVSFSRGRSNCPEVFCKKGVLRIFTKFTGKHLVQIHIFKQRIWHRCFPVNFVKFLRTSFFIEHLLWLLLERSMKILQCTLLDVFDRASMKTKHYIFSLLIVPPLYKYPTGNYMFKVNNKNTRTRGEICSKLTIKTPERDLPQSD